MIDNRILDNVLNLYNMYKKGFLGGDILPEDSNPILPKESAQNYHFFTLPMALNYQRNSYALWESAKKTFLDSDLTEIFNPEAVTRMEDEVLLRGLVRHKLAIQPMKQTQIWRTISETVCKNFSGDIRNLFIQNEWHIPYIMECVQKKNKKLFPYISGLKLFSYWLHVIERYTDARFTGREFLSIAPDTHIIKATVKLGIVRQEEVNSNNIQQVVSDQWKELLTGTGLQPIDMHTPLWFWSRGGFRDIQPYTKLLLSAIPIPDPEIEKNKQRNSINEEHEKLKPYEKAPLLVEVEEGHFVASDVL